MVTAGIYSDQFASGMYRYCRIYLAEHEDELPSVLKLKTIECSALMGALTVFPSLIAVINLFN